MPDIDLSKLEFASIVIKNDLQSARERIVQPILDQVADLGYCKDDRFALRLGLEEAIANAFKHGNKCEPHRSICARWAACPECIVIYVTDEGVGFDPRQVPDPRCTENLEKPCGRGLFLMKSYMTELRFNDRGNEVCLIKVRKNKGSRQSHAKGTSS
jgi:serine/threonine-protein kinase RsbW